MDTIKHHTLNTERHNLVFSIRTQNVSFLEFGSLTILPTFALYPKRRMKFSFLYSINRLRFILCFLTINGIILVHRIRKPLYLRYAITVYLHLKQVAYWQHIERDQQVFFACFIPKWEINLWAIVAAGLILFCISRTCLQIWIWHL